MSSDQLLVQNSYRASLGCQTAMGCGHAGRRDSGYTGYRTGSVDYCRNSTRRAY